MPDLVLLRHGQSTWNAQNLFTGWVDVDLSPRARPRPRQPVRLLAAEQADGLDLRVLHTSVLKRAIRTANSALDELDRSWLPVRRSWRLNERHYGALQGKNKKETAEEFGADQVKKWRRSYDIPPPALPVTDPSHPSHDARYRDVPAGCLAVSRMPGRRRRAHGAVLGGRHRPRPRHPRRRGGGGARQLDPGARQVPEARLRRRHRQAGGSDGGPVVVPSRRAT